MAKNSSRCGRKRRKENRIKHSSQPGVWAKEMSLWLHKRQFFNCSQSCTDYGLLLVTVYSLFMPLSGWADGWGERETGCNSAFYGYQLRGVIWLDGWLNGSVWVTLSRCN